MIRQICASRETERHLKLQKKKEGYVFSFFPLDRHDCSCQKVIQEYREEMTAMPQNLRDEKVKIDKPITCPRSKHGMNRYKIVCNNCGAIQGYVWSIDDKLSDWCDFHYVNYTDGKNWFGCFTPHISPIDGTLCFECTCGQDTRDFRANSNLPSVTAYIREKANARGRKFGQPNSKFRLELVKAHQVRVK